MKLQQKKTEIELRAEIAVAGAERRVYEESEMEEMRRSQVAKSTGFHEQPQKENYFSNPVAEFSKQPARHNISNGSSNQPLEIPEMPASISQSPCSRVEW